MHLQDPNNHGEAWQHGANLLRAGRGEAGRDQRCSPSFSLYLWPREERETALWLLEFNSLHSGPKLDLNRVQSHLVQDGLPCLYRSLRILTEDVASPQTYL